MCGFLQVLQRNRPVNRERFASALKTLQHRGPDDSGSLFSEFSVQAGAEAVPCYAAFGHQRLSILDLSDRSHQPFACDGQVFLYNGELYNYRELGAELAQRGVALTTSGDTEVFMQLLRLDGAGVMQRCNGMWAFSLFDSQAHTLLIGRDRFGKKPLFYYLDADTLVLSSSIRAIRHYLGLSLEFTRSALVEYFLFGAMRPGTTEQTHFRNICQALPGHSYRFDCRDWRLQGEQWFDAYHRPQGALPGLAETLQDAVAARLVSDRPVALLLSGGVDSSLLLSILYATRMHERLTIFMGDTGRSDDYDYARRCVQQLGVPAETVVLDYETRAFESFLQVCLHHEKAFPFSGNALAMPHMYSAIAAQGIPVVLDGSGGDELFGGYRGLQFQAAARDAWRALDWQWLRDGMHCQDRDRDARRMIIAALAPAWYRRFRLQSGDRAAGWLHPALKMPLRDVLGTPNPDPMYDPTLDFNSLLCRDIAPGGQLGEWVWHNDRNAMMASVENRSPLLDYRLQAFAFTGYAAKYHQCWNKHELRQAFSAFQSLPTQWRSQKQGFRWDGRQFLDNNRTRILELIESSTCMDEFLDTRKLAGMVRRMPKLLYTSLSKQALCLAGIEQMLIRD